ncbi:bifunctional aldehyde dehydrogenase/enoyl-CoA hydratase [Klebsiella pneumoniae subsp. ozaenae]|uniref:Bifunctional aldehyde dehydrogenase/enoyl-CoA hydratase n=1 Tax=Klebsiella pneumoniae subsp. ozaenae TaxID=574 RepID=A0A377ZS64_KLEPO|nr:bifunctional aldehyde dehydrogenase/enoyl-CoA hydratase [Klebsiella pneumoniae subsp. ozaenae]
MLATIGQQWVRGAQVNEDRIHPFRKYFEEIQPGDSLLTPRRTLTEADIVNFACLSGDHFYAHMDKIAAAESIFGERVVHGYFLIAAAAGLFVDAGVGPVIANYGMETCALLSRSNRATPFRFASPVSGKRSNVSAAPMRKPPAWWNGRWRFSTSTSRRWRCIPF